MNRLILEIRDLNEDWHDHLVNTIDELLLEDPHYRPSQDDHPTVWNITEEYNRYNRVINALLEEGRTRVPSDIDKKSEEYVQRVQLHNIALAELSEALHQIGYRQK